MSGQDVKNCMADGWKHGPVPDIWKGSGQSLGRDGTKSLGDASLRVSEGAEEFGARRVGGGHGLWDGSCMEESDPGRRKPRSKAEFPADSLSAIHQMADGPCWMIRNPGELPNHQFLGQVFDRSACVGQDKGVAIEKLLNHGKSGNLKGLHIVLLCDLVPDILFVKYDSVFYQKLPQFVLK
jgi:hypothetical protein